MDMDMDNSTMEASNSTMVDMMTPYLHFTGGDFLIFKDWQPNSSGAIAGACFGLIAIAIIERWIVAIRRVLGNRWRQRALGSLKEHVSKRGAVQFSSGKKSVDSDDIQVQEEIRDNALSYSSTSSPRTTIPFILVHDVPRGVLYSIQALLGYTLMLACMTFHAAYVISIIVGLGLGETLFGRMG